MDPSQPCHSLLPVHCCVPTKYRQGPPLRSWQTSPYWRLAPWTARLVISRDWHIKWHWQKTSILYKLHCMILYINGIFNQVRLPASYDDMVSYCRSLVIRHSVYLSAYSRTFGAHCFLAEPPLLGAGSPQVSVIHVSFCRSLSSQILFWGGSTYTVTMASSGLRYGVLNFTSCE